MANAEDVKEIVTPTEDEKVVEPSDSKGDDKAKNFAELRRKLEATEAEKAELARKLAEKEENNRSLGDDEEKDKKPDPTIKVLFERDLKEATRQWNKANKATAEEWAVIKSKVSLRGDETMSEISDKIDEAYHSLPSVREKREKEIALKARKEAMREFSDDELDSGGAGGDVDLGGGTPTRLNDKTKKWARGLGLTPEEMKDIDEDSDPSDWKIGPSPTRKFFQA